MRPFERHLEKIKKNADITQTVAHGKRLPMNSYKLPTKNSTIAILKPRMTGIQHTNLVWLVSELKWVIEKVKATAAVWKIKTKFKTACKMLWNTLEQLVWQGL